MTVRKRCLLWDWTNTKGVPAAMDKVDFSGPIHSVSNWNTWTPPELKGRAPFRPMVRTDGQTSGNDWANVENSKETIIHFYNEPERNGISAQHAADVWNKQMIPLRQQKGKKLVSPSCASDANGQAWLAEFMTLIRPTPPDYLGLHYYGTDSSAAIKYIEDMHAKHPHPVIVSEIASISRDYSAVVGFTTHLANWMDETSWIYEYGFFGCMRAPADTFVSPQAQLMKPDGSFTTLMYKLMREQPMKA
ncbi:glycoside hydrolase family 128 protein [Glonium stellatum]|uniref:Glycoside hydrolase family 128 protein n=1 Tax=Glonium stellatum TaxID=574774 RepID=A0A8E2EXM8_9PEZI|nr:glycoside hydrolase family 128 protein [Glonium stellatum]